MSSSSRTREKMKKKNNNSTVDVLVISSSEEKEEVEEENEVEDEEEVKSSNNSNQQDIEEIMEIDEDNNSMKNKNKMKMKQKNKDVHVTSDNVTGSCVFPTNRINRIIRSEGTDSRITQEAIFLVNKATIVVLLGLGRVQEQFLDLFCEDVYANVAQERRKAVDYKHISSAVSKGKRYDFLSDFMPEKIRAEDALSERLPGI